MRGRRRDDRGHLPVDGAPPTHIQRPDPIHCPGLALAAPRPARLVGRHRLRVPGVLDAYAEALEGWGEALAWLRGVVDFSSDLRPRQY